MMKRLSQLTAGLLILGVLVFALPYNAFAAMGFFQGTTCSVTVSPCTTTAFASTVVAGDLMVVNVVDDSGIAEPAMTVTDSKGNTYTRIADTGANDTGTETVWWAPITTGGTSFTVTVTNTGGAFARMDAVAQEFNGFTGTPTFDKVSAFTSGSSVSPLSLTSGTLTQANEMVVGSFAHYSTVSAFSLGSGYTNLGTISVANAANAQESKVVAATTAVTAPATIAASREWNAYVSTFYSGSSTPVVPISVLTLRANYIVRGQFLVK